RPSLVAVRSLLSRDPRPGFPRPREKYPHANSRCDDRQARSCRFILTAASEYVLRDGPPLFAHSLAGHAAARDGSGCRLELELSRRGRTNSDVDVCDKSSVSRPQHFLRITERNADAGLHIQVWRPVPIISVGRVDTIHT